MKNTKGVPLIVFILLLLIQSLGACGGGGGGDGGSGAGAEDAVATSRLSGTISFERVPHDPVSFGLDYENTYISPGRGLVVSAVYVGEGSQADTGVTDENGFYELVVEEGSEVRVRVQARMVGDGQPGWDIRVADNTAGNALYAMESEPVTVSGDTELNLIATSGWDGQEYSGARVAAPFAILDTIYGAVEFLIESGQEDRLPDLRVYWSPNNRRSETTNRSAGELWSSHYRPRNGSIYLLGMAGEDTEEFDQHVILHEFAHYYEHRLSRWDSIGGPHSVAQWLDHRLAFNEGFATAFAVIVTGDPVYRDSLGEGQAGGWGYDVRTNPWGVVGWYGEASMIQLIYGLAGLMGDGDERRGFPAIHQVLTGELSTGEAPVSIFPFVHQLKQQYPAAFQDISALVQAQQIAEVVDGWATLETNNAGAEDVLPLYRDLVVGGSPVTLCANSQFDSAGDGNKLSVRQFLRLEVAEQRSFSLLVEGDEAAKPKFYLLENGQRHHYSVASEDGRSASLEATLEPGTYVLEVTDGDMIKGEKTGRICMEVSIS
ncbi:hypothetical protein [Microbulbifer yueqingensis]|nr:hypothetical protein [Microbulbifer yueqingensis]